MSQHYLNPSRASDPYALPNLWVEYMSAEDAPERPDYGFEDDDNESPQAGYYACICFPGCMPDSEWVGPFESEADAVEYMRRTFGGDE